MSRIVLRDAFQAEHSLILADEDARPGGALLHETHEIDGKRGVEWAAGIIGELEANPDVTIMARTTAFGCYDGNIFGAVERVNKVAQGRPHIVDAIVDGEIDLVFNTTEGWQSLKDSASIRKSAVSSRIPYFTTAAASVAAVRAIGALRTSELEVRPLQDYCSTADR